MHLHSTSLVALVAASLLTLSSVAPAANAQQATREEKVQADRKKVLAEGFWIYNDLDKGIAEAKRTGKPLLVVLRCVPCVECVKLDDDLVNQDRRVRPLLEKFVRVRLVSANGLDLSLFQFDYDQSFAAFLLNADGTVYGRFGTRSHRTNWSDDVSVDGLAKALQGALDLHAAYPKNRAGLAGKKGPVAQVARPELYPSLRGRYGPRLADKGKVVPSCIHCHQVGEAQREARWKAGKSLPDEMLFPYPHPRVVGLVLDPREPATVLRVEKGSLAEKAGLRRGDAITALGGQPLLSIADVQWVLHRASAGGEALRADVRRGGAVVEATLNLPKGWRRADDLSWRASTWLLRRMALGGLLLEELPAEERKTRGWSEGAMALRARHVGQYGPHAAAARAGFQKGDILTAVGGRSDLRRETDLIAYVLGKHRAGDRLQVTVVRGKQKLALTLPVQD